MIASEGLYDNECDTYNICGWVYATDWLQVTENAIDRMLRIEKIAMLKDNGMSAYDAERYVANGVITYENSTIGFEEFKSNMTDVETDDIVNEWERLRQIYRIDELGNVIGNYRIEFFN